MTISPSLIGYIEGYLSVMQLRRDIPEDVKLRTKELAERIRGEMGLEQPKGGFTMKKLLLLMMLIPTTAWGEIQTTVGPEISYIRYEEKGLPLGRDIIDVVESGVMYGVHGTVEYTEKIYLALDGKYSFGWVDYSGSGTIDDIEDYMYEVRGLVGIPVKSFTFYTGYGYRYLNDDSSGKLTSTGLFGYERESNYHYVPVGLKFKGLRAEVDVLVKGKQISHLDAIDQFFPRLEHEQDSGAGVKVSYEFKREFKSFNVTLTPFFRWWKIQTSKEHEGFIEPRNTSLEVGGGVLVRF